MNAGVLYNFDICTLVSVKHVLYKVSFMCTFVLYILLNSSAIGLEFKCLSFFSFFLFSTLAL